MSPVHVTPKGAIGVVLVEHMVVMVPINWPIRVVHPVCGGQQVKLRSQHISLKVLLRGDAWGGRRRTLKTKPNDGPRNTVEKESPSVHRHRLPLVCQLVANRRLSIGAKNYGKSRLLSALHHSGSA